MEGEAKVQCRFGVVPHVAFAGHPVCTQPHAPSILKATTLRIKDGAAADRLSQVVQKRPPATPLSAAATASEPKKKRAKKALECTLAAVCCLLHFTMTVRREDLTPFSQKSTSTRPCNDGE